jgi:hypothetical protein
MTPYEKIDRDLRAIRWLLIANLILNVIILFADKP